MTFDWTELKKRLQPRSALALTVEPDRIALSVVRREDTGETLPPIHLPLAAESWLNDPAKAGAELAAALESAGIRERRCVVCLPTQWALSASADLPEVSAEDLRSYFELRAEREFSTSVADLRLASLPYSMPNGSVRATLVAIANKRIESLEKLLAAAGCHAISLSLALDGCLSAPEPTLHLISHADHTGLVISSGGGIAAIRSLAATDASDVDRFAREIRITLGRLPEPIRKGLQRARWVGEPDDTLRAALEKAGFTHLVVESPTSANAAIEPARLYLREQPVPFEFVVPEINPWPAKLERFNTQRGRQIAAAMGAAILLLLLMVLFRSHRESSLNADWNGMRETVENVESLQQKIRQYRPWFEPSPQKLQMLETLIAAFPERGDVWTRSVQIGAWMDKSESGSRAVQSTTASKVTVSGFARSSAALLGLQDRLRKQSGVSELQLQQYRGNNPIQFSLSYKWEPKHDK